MAAERQPEHPQRDVVVIGASAGGVEAITRVVKALPADLHAAVVVVLHMAATSPSALPRILARNCELPTSAAADGVVLETGRVYVSVPDRHLLVSGDRLILSAGPRENGHRPAVDPLFRSAARSLGSRVIGVVMSGVLDDGTAGLHVVKQAGGLAIVQDPDDALYPAMPINAMTATDVDQVLAAEQIAKYIVDQTTPGPDGRPPLRSAEDVDVEVAFSVMDADAMHGEVGPGEPSGYSCPDCHGVLNVIEEGELLRFRCRVGHAWSREALVAAQTQDVETALWGALRSLEEKASLARKLAASAQLRGAAITHERFADQAFQATRNADTVRQLLVDWGLNATPVREDVS
jgi:two-component system chemotaxis response regulator CheB